MTEEIVMQILQRKIKKDLGKKITTTVNIVTQTERHSDHPDIEKSTYNSLNSCFLLGAKLVLSKEKW
jgi:hypothetical protein